MDQVIDNFRRFHPKPEVIQCSHPVEEPEFIKPYFGLRLFPVWHIGTDYLHEIGKTWYDYLCDKGVTFIWHAKATDIDFENNTVQFSTPGIDSEITYNRLIFGVGKSGIDFGKKLIERNNFPTEAKPVQIGVRFEAPQKHFQKLIDISYDFKLYRKFEDKGVSLRSFCTNNNAAFVAVEETYGNHSYNGHAKKDEAYRNDMTNFGILMEIRGIDKPFDWSREAVKKLQVNGTGTYYSPSHRVPSKTSEGEYVKTEIVNSLDPLYDAIGDNAIYIEDFIEETYGNHSYNGHAKKDEAYRNDMTNFGILMEIRGIDKPFDWSREAVKKLQVNGTGTYYSPSHRVPSKTSEGEYVKTEIVNSLDPLYDAIGDNAIYIEDFIEDMTKIFPTLGNDWGVYMPEVKYLSPEPLVDRD